MRNYHAKDVTQYIASSPKEAHQTLNALRSLIKGAIPNVEEEISWGVPFYRSNGLLAGYAVFTHHVTFGLCFTFTKEDRETLESKGYKTGSKTVQIRFDDQIPEVILKRMLKARAKENKAKKKVKNT